MLRGGGRVLQEWVVIRSAYLLLEVRRLLLLELGRWLLLLLLLLELRWWLSLLMRWRLAGRLERQCPKLGWSPASTALGGVEGALGSIEP